MYLTPELEIQPLGFYRQPGIDELIRFKFIARVNHPSRLFDASKVDASKLVSNYDVQALDLKATETWWDVGGQNLTGGSFIIPAHQTKGECGLNVGYLRNTDNTLTVYVLWQET